MSLDRYVNLRGLDFHYRDWGGGGRPIVLLHGLASSCRIWDLMAPLLTEERGSQGASFRVLALDQRGHGQSARPEEGYDFETVVGDLVAFVESLGLERPTVVGHSWGGSVALQYGAAFPGLTSGLALVDGGYLELSAIPGMTWERAEKELAPPHLDGIPLNALLMMARDHPSLARIWSPRVEEILLACFDISADGSVHPRLSRDRHMRIVRALWEQRVSALYRRLRCPSLLIRAQQEPTSERERLWAQAVDDCLQGALALLPEARLITMEDTIHDIPLHRPKELAAAIADFADSLP